LALLRTGLAAGHRRVEARDAALAARSRDLAREIRRGRRMVDEHGALLHCAEHAVRPEHDLADVRIVTDAREHEVRAGGSIRRGLGEPTAVLGRPALRL